MQPAVLPAAESTVLRFGKWNSHKCDDAGDGGAAHHRFLPLVAVGALSAPSTHPSGSGWYRFHSAGAAGCRAVPQSSASGAVAHAGRLCHSRRHPLAHPETGTEPAAAHLPVFNWQQLFPPAFLRVLHAHYPAAARCGAFRRLKYCL